jgi:hypothetical protein
MQKVAKNTIFRFKNLQIAKKKWIFVIFWDPKIYFF